MDASFSTSIIKENHRHSGQQDIDIQEVNSVVNLRGAETRRQLFSNQEHELLALRNSQIAVIDQDISDDFLKKRERNNKISSFGTALPQALHLSSSITQQQHQQQQQLQNQQTQRNYNKFQTKISRISKLKQEQQQIQGINSSDNIESKEILKKIGPNNKNVQIQFRMLQRLMFVRSFIKKLKSMVRYRYPQILTLRHYNILGDKAVFLQQDAKHAVTQIKKIGFCINKLPVLAPDGLVASFWDILLFLFNSFLMLYIPMLASFPELMQQPDHAGFSLFVVTMLILEMLVKINTGIFLEDLITTIVWMLKRDEAVSDVFLFSFCARIYHSSHYLTKIDDFFQIQSHFSVVFELVKLIGIILTIANSFACGFHRLAVDEIENGALDSWVQQFNLAEDNWQIRYLNAFYYTIITMVTVGYGDISPKTSREKLYVVIMTIFSCGLFGYALNTIGSIFQEMVKKEQVFKQTKQQIRQFMNKRNISKNLQIRVVRYLEFLYQQKIEEGNNKGEDIIETLSTDLKDEVKIESYCHLLQKIEIFGQYFSKSILSQISTMMKERTILPGEILFQQDDVCEYIYFINKGSFDLYTTKVIQKEGEEMLYQNFPICTKIKNDYMFESAFMLQGQHRYSAKCASTAHIFQLSYNDFYDIVKNFSKEFQIFCQLREKIAYSELQFGNQCQICRESNHDHCKCPIVNPKNQSNIILLLKQIKKNNDNQIKRQPFTRRKKSPLSNPLVSNRQVQTDLVDKRISLILSVCSQSLINQQLGDLQNLGFENNEQFYKRTYPLIKENPVCNFSSSGTSSYFNSYQGIEEEDEEEEEDDDESNNDEAIKSLSDAISQSSNRKESKSDEITESSQLSVQFQETGKNQSLQRSSCTINVNSLQKIDNVRRPSKQVQIQEVSNGNGGKKRLSSKHFSAISMNNNELQQYQIDKQLFDYSFDKPGNFTHFFTNYNYQEIISQISSKHKKYKQLTSRRKK